MDKLIEYLNKMTPDKQREFCIRCETSVGYLRKAASIGQKLNESLCIRIERESGRDIKCESIRPDVDWAYLRSSAA